MIEGGIQFFHYIQEVSGRIGSNSKFKTALQDWEAKAEALLLNNRLFSESKVVKCPKKDKLWDVESADGS